MTILLLLLDVTRILLILQWKCYCFYKKESCCYRRKLLRKKLSIRMNIMCQDLETEEIANVTSLLNLNICFFSALDKEQ